MSQRKPTDQEKIVVIGGGVVGMTMAMILAERGHRLTVIEKNVIGAGTSANTFAWANGTAKIETEAYHRLNALGVRFHRDLAERFGSQSTGFHTSGAMEWADGNDPAALEALRHRFEKLSEWDYRVTWHGPSQLREIEPAIHFAADAEGLVAGDDGWLNVRTWLGFVKDRIQSLGGEVREDCEAGEMIMSPDDRVSGVQTPDGTIDCDHVIVASGIDTPDVLASLTGHEAFATRFPLARSPGLLVRAPADGPAASLSKVIYTSALPGHFHVRPHTDERVLIGADDTDGAVSEDPSEEQVRTSAKVLLDRTAELIPGFNGAGLIDQCTTGIGIRPVPADGQSLAGLMPGSDQVWIVVTHSGITLCPAIANLIADSFDSGQVSDVLKPFDPARLLGD